MKSLIIRDDDLSFWSKPDEIDSIYRPLFDRGIKISFAVIPFAVKMFNAGNFDTFYQDENSATPIGKNTDIVDYIKEQNNKGLIEIMLHGYNHLYRFECEGKIRTATKENLAPARLENKHIRFIGEYTGESYATLYRKTKHGKEYLEDTFGVKIVNFVPPSNAIDRQGLRAIVNNRLNMSCGMLMGRRYNRESTLSGLKAYCHMRLFYFACKMLGINSGARRISYPYIMNFGRHKELHSHAITPVTDWQVLERQFSWCCRYKLPFQLASHYWELSDPLQERYMAIIERALENGYRTYFLKEVFE